MDLTIQNIPQELRDLKQWTVGMAASGKLRKAPQHHQYEPNGGLSVYDAVKEAGEDKLSGIYTTDKDQYILGDIDHVKYPNNPLRELPIALAQLIKTTATYYETSPSGEGIRFIVKLKSPEDKKVVVGKKFLYKHGDDKDKAQIVLANGWVTITRKPTDYSSDSIGEVTLAHLEKVFNIHYKSVDIDTKQTIKEHHSLPGFSEFAKKVLQLPMDSNPRIHRAFQDVFNDSYQHYDYWMKVIMAIHDYGKFADMKMDAFSLADEWSSLDEASYKGAGDIQKHWKSFGEKDRTITFRTIYKLCSMYELRYPLVKSTKDQKKNGLSSPLIGAIDNFYVLLKHYNITFIKDKYQRTQFYLSGDADELDKHFTTRTEVIHGTRYYGPYDAKTISYAFIPFMQRNGFTEIGASKIREFVTSTIGKVNETIDFLKMYFDTPFEQLHLDYQDGAEFYHTSTFDYVFNCIKIDSRKQDREKEEELALYKRYYYCWIMGFIRSMYYDSEFDMNNCVLLLTGPEQTRKTTHFQIILVPKPFRHMITSTTHGFRNEGDMRDLTKIAANSILMVWDELEQFLKSDTEANFKKVLDGNTQGFIDKYETAITKVKPVSIFGATSNKTTFNIGDEGSRRLFHIPITWVDTDALLRVNWHKLINDMKKEFDKSVAAGGIPWLLSDSELYFQSKLHTGLKAKSNIDLALEELFDFSNVWEALDTNIISGISSLQNDTSGRLMSTKDVRIMLQDYDVRTEVNRANLIRSLKRQCSAYTGTVRRPKSIRSPDCTVRQGEATQGVHKRWVMPPLKTSGSPFKNKIVES